MSAIIKARTNLMSGGVALVSHDLSTDENGGIVVNARFTALNAFANQVYSAFNIGSAVHPLVAQEAEVREALSAYKSTDSPTLASVTITPNFGLLNISASYKANTEENSDISETGETTGTELSVTAEERSLSGLVTLTRFGTALEIEGVDTELPFSFDYLAYNISQSNGFPKPKAPSEPYNVQAPWRTTFGRKTYKNYIGTFDVGSFKKYLNSKRTETIERSVTRIYIQTVSTDEQG